MDDEMDAVIERWVERQRVWTWLLEEARWWAEQSRDFYENTYAGSESVSPAFPWEGFLPKRIG